MPHLLHVFPGFGIDGPQLRLGRLAGLIGTGEIRHTVVSLNGDTAARIMIPADIPMNVLTPGSARLLNHAGVKQSLLDEMRPDILLTYGWEALGWGRAGRGGHTVPHIHIEDSVDVAEIADADHPRMQERRAALCQGIQVVVPSKALHRIASSQWRVPQDKLHHIPNGIDAYRFVRPPCEATLERLGVRAGDLVLGAIAPLVSGQGIIRLLRAVSQLPTAAKLLIVGDGPDRGDLEGMADALGLTGRVIFAGRLRRPELVLGRFDLFALTSDAAQMPHALMEAMAAGRPVVAPAVGDVPEMVAPSNRPFIVPPQDVMALVRAMTDLLSSPALRARIGAANQARALALFPTEAMERGYLDLLRRTGAFSRSEVVAA